MRTEYLLAGMLVMCLMTYLIRVTPMVVFRNKITNNWIKSFLYYVPYAVLSAMTFPAVFYCTKSPASAAIGCVVGIILAYFKRSLLTVAVGSALGVYFSTMIGL
jgi:branched-subunit amino acid transport protein